MVAAGVAMEPLALAGVLGVTGACAAVELRSSSTAPGESTESYFSFTLPSAPLGVTTRWGEALTQQTPGTAMFLTDPKGSSRAEHILLPRKHPGRAQC